MEVHPNLLSQLDAVSSSLDDGLDLCAILDVLTDDIRRAVPSFVGLRMTVSNADTPVVLATVDAAAAPTIRSSLLLPLDLVGVAPPGSHVVYYAAAPGAFTGLAATARDQYRLAAQVVLDGHLTTAGQPEVAGVDHLATINQAVGVLIHHGHTPSEALGHITRRAHTAGRTHPQAALDLIAAHIRP